MTDTRRTGNQLATIANDESLDLETRTQAADEYEARRMAQCPGVDEDGKRCVRFDLECSNDEAQYHIRSDFTTFPR